MFHFTCMYEAFCMRNRFETGLEMPLLREGGSRAESALRVYLQGV